MTDRAATAARRLAPWLLLAALAYVPLLLTAPGEVAADTKQYLYLDPGALLARAPWMWDAHVGAGTVTHQQIGYLWPMGPFSWAFEQLGAPDWVAQRLWLGTLVFAAGAGVLALMWTLGRRGAGALVAALAYACTPYSLDYAARISAILVAWAALPWLLLLMVRALRAGGWRHPAAFALVAMTAGSVNATSLVLVGVAPVLWVPYAVWVARESTGRRALATVVKIGALTMLASLWWAAGLAVQAGHGLDVLSYTETLDVVARTSLASEVLRGLGNWFFYGRDALGPWLEASLDYTQRPVVMAASFAVPVVALLAAVTTRWRHRAFFVALVVVGTVVAVGVHPYDDPSPLGAAYKSLADESSAAFALRSVGRAVPLVALGLAVLLGVGVEALLRRSARAGAVAVVAVVALVVVAFAPFWRGAVVDRNLRRPEELPAHWEAAAGHLDRRAHAGRVLEIPGSDFAAYRWGNTVDPVTPGLTSRPFLARELVPYGSPPSAALLIALDRRLQEGVFEPAALAPVARLFGVGDVVLRSDLQYERYRTPRPRPTWALFDPPPPGLGRPARFGPAARSVPVIPMDDEIELATPAQAPDPPEVAVFPVVDASPIVRAVPAGAPLVVAGDAEGVVDAAAAGLLERGRPVLFSASRTAVPPGAHLLLTDSNRRRARSWGLIRESTGYTEQAGERSLDDDPRDARLPVFPEAGDDAHTVTELHGVRSVRASGYGNPVSYTPGDRPAMALDGDVATAWTVGALDDPTGERLLVELSKPVTTDRVTLVQPVTGPRDRFVTRATIRLDGEVVRRRVALGESSRREAGQRIDLGGRRSFRQLEVRIDAVNAGRRADYRGASGVGFAEVRVGDVRLREVVRLPRDLLDGLGESSLDHPLTVLLSRARGNPAEDFRAEEERAMTRAFSLPAPRSFTVAGTGRVSAAAADDVVDRLLGRAADVPGGSVVATSSQRLPGFVGGRASAALDGDPSTAWRGPRGSVVGEWLDVALAAPATLDHLDLQLVADGRHSLPTRLRVEADGGETRVADVPPVERGDDGHVASARVTFPAVSATRLRVVVEAADERVTREYYSGQPIALPVAVAELGIPGVRAPALPPSLPDACRTDLLEVDGRPVGLRLVGPTAAAERREGVTLEPCGSDGPLALGPGRHEVRTFPGGTTGVDVDRLVLRSPAAGGAAEPPPAEAPRVEVAREGRASYDVRVSGARGPFWLVLGQSHHDGWEATLAGRDLGDPTLVDGYANGWLVSPPPGGDDVEIALRWAPQSRVWIALAISAAAVVLCLVAAVVGAARRRPRPRAVDDDAAATGRPRDDHTRAQSRNPGTCTPELALTELLSDEQASPSRRATVVGALVAAVTAGLAVRPLAGVLAALVVVAGLRWRAARVAITIGGPGALALAGTYVVVQQVRYRFPTSLDWPTHFERAGTLGWAAVVLLAAHLWIGHLRRRATRATDSADD